MKNTRKFHEKPKYKVIDLFAGAGGLSNGFEQTGKFEVIGAVEINPAALKTYIANHGDNTEIIIKTIDCKNSDISLIDFSKFLYQKSLTGDKLIVIGGPPCQGFSNANRQKNYLISGNNQLVKQFVRAIREIKPMAFLMENVRSMGSNLHKFFVTEHIENTIYELSSMRHLSEITKQGKDKSNILWKDDSIILIETTYCELTEIFEEAIIMGISMPLIESEVYISRLRSIERNALKLRSYKLTSDKEKKETFQLINHLEDIVENKSEYRELKHKQIVKDTIAVLSEIIEREVSNEEISKSIGPLLDLLRFQKHYQELINERIVFDRPLKVVQRNTGVTIVTAYVKSYNVVDYLNYVFSYYGYDIDQCI